MRRDEGLTPGKDRDDEEVRKEREEEDRLDREHLQRLKRARQARATKLLLALGVLVILIIFVISNSQRVPVDFVVAEREPRLIWIMLACAFLGGIVGFILGRPGRQFRFHRKDEDAGKRRR